MSGPPELLGRTPNSLCPSAALAERVKRREMMRDLKKGAALLSDVSIFWVSTRKVRLGYE
jgi:hypothetical protein